MKKPKKLLWDTVMSHFNLPKGLTDREPEKGKKYALKKMATQFRSCKKRLWADYVNAEK